MTFAPLPDSTYEYILADPPWSYRNYTSKVHGSAKSWYDCLTVEELCELPVKDIAEDNSALFMWITGPKFIEGAHIPIMEAWGFRPVTVAFVWTKTNRNGSPYMGLGFYTRQNTEYCLLGLRGKMKRASASVLQSLSSPRLVHSQKPEGFHLKIEELFGKRKGIELFARNEPTCSDSWDVWGNQLEAPVAHNPNWVESLSPERQKIYE